jgi:hypothetical protein
VAIELVRRTGCTVVGVDQGPEMLAVGRQRVAHAGLGDRISLVEAGAERLPFRDAEFAGLTYAYLLRFTSASAFRSSGGSSRPAGAGSAASWVEASARSPRSGRPTASRPLGGRRASARSGFAA